VQESGILCAAEGEGKQALYESADTGLATVEFSEIEIPCDFDEGDADDTQMTDVSPPLVRRNLDAQRQRKQEDFEDSKRSKRRDFWSVADALHIYLVSRIPAKRVLRSEKRGIHTVGGFS